MVVLMIFLPPRVFLALVTESEEWLGIEYTLKAFNDLLVWLSHLSFSAFSNHIEENPQWWT